MHDLLHDITLCIVTAWLLGLVAQFLRQPVLLAYLAGGFLLGPNVAGLVGSAESIHSSCCS
jgi:Kef-type K+ transport system membrane component KefB